jgi:hypothetical protein
MTEHNIAGLVDVLVQLQARLGTAQASPPPHSVAVELPRAVALIPFPPIWISRDPQTEVPDDPERPELGLNRRVADRRGFDGLLMASRCLRTPLPVGGRQVLPGAFSCPPTLAVFRPGPRERHKCR